jgi:hypothetical protein
MTRWKDTTISTSEIALGALGDLFVHRDPDGLYAWGLCDGPRFIFCCEDRYANPEAAKRIAESWLKRALRQATKRMEVK